MLKELSIYINTPDTSLARWIQEQIKTLVGVQVFQGDLPSDKANPDIMIYGEGKEEKEPIFATLKKLKKSFPSTSIVLISTIRDPQHIVAAMKAGASEYLIPPLAAESFIQTIEELRAKIISVTPLTKAAAGRLFSFISSKGGLGATVISVNTAAALAEERKDQIALVDMSLQSGDSSTLLDIVPQSTITDLCMNFHRLDAAFLQRAMTRHDSGINFLPAPKNPEENLSIKAEQVKTILEIVSKNFDAIVVDCVSMSVNSCSVEVFNLSEKVFILTDLSVPAIRNCSRLMDLIKKKGVSPDKVEIAVNRFIKGKNLKISEIEESLKKRIYWFFPNDFDSTISSINMGVPLVKYQSRSALAKSIQEFVRKLRNPSDFADYRGVKGLFGRTV